MELMVVLSAVLAGLGVVMMVFGGPMARWMAKLAEVVFWFPCRVWPDLRVFVNFVFGHARAPVMVRLLGAAYVVSGVVLLLVVLGKR